MRNLLFYAVAGTALGGAGHAFGLGMGAVLLLSLIVPPALLIAWIVLQSRSIDRRTREGYWSGDTRSR